MSVWFYPCGCWMLFSPSHLGCRSACVICQWLVDYCCVPVPLPCTPTHPISMWIRLSVCGGLESTLPTAADPVLSHRITAQSFFHLPHRTWACGTRVPCELFIHAAVVVFTCSSQDRIPLAFTSKCVRGIEEWGFRSLLLFFIFLVSFFGSKVSSRPENRNSRNEPIVIKILIAQAATVSILGFDFPPVGNIYILYNSSAFLAADSPKIQNIFLDPSYERKTESGQHANNGWVKRINRDAISMFRKTQDV